MTKKSIAVHSSRIWKCFLLEGPMPFIPRDNSTMVVPTIDSDEIFVEIRKLPAELITRSGQDPFRIKDIQYFAPNLYKYLFNESVESSSQYNGIKTRDILKQDAAECSYTDINCVTRVSDIKSGVIRLPVGNKKGRWWCSGSLLKDNESTTDIPYILTAGHCVQGKLKVKEISFWYESPDCNLIDEHSWYEKTTLPVTRLGYENGIYIYDPDWALLKMNLLDLKNVPKFLNAKTSKQPVGEKIYQIHHPGGDKKKISKGILKEKHEVNQEFVYENGDTSEGGSSGSPILDEDDLNIVGVFFGKYKGGGICSSTVRHIMTRYKYIYNKIKKYIKPSLATPVITSIDHPDSSVTKKSFFITIKVENTGNYNSPKGHIHIAFPSYKSEKDKKLVSVYSKSPGLKYKEYLSGYKDLKKRNGTRDRYADYLHVVASDSNWKPNEENYITLKIYPKSTGNLRIWYRASMKSENKHFYNAPSDSSYDVIDIDQEWPENEISINIDPCTLPSAPLEVSASEGSSKRKVRIKWGSIDRATSYKVYRSASSGGKKTKIGTTLNTSYGDTTAERKKTYYYWIKAKNFCGTSGYSLYDTGFRK